VPEQSRPRPVGTAQAPELHLAPHTWANPVSPPTRRRATQKLYKGQTSAPPTQRSEASADLSAVPNEYVTACTDKPRGPQVRTGIAARHVRNRASSEGVDGGGCWCRAWTTGTGGPTTAVANNQPPPADGELWTVDGGAGR